MSYNIDTWRTITLEALVIPLSAFDKRDLRWREDNYVSVGLGGDMGIVGVIKNDQLHVGKIKLRDVGSGQDFNNKLLPALEKSVGALDALLVWEGGDSMSLLEVKNGVIKHEDVDPARLIQRIRELERENAELKARL